MATTTKKQRIAVAAIAVLTILGTVGTYLGIVLQNNDNATASQQTTTSNSSTPPLVSDPTAYKVSGPVTSLTSQDLKIGTGDAVVSSSDTVTVHYKGTIAQTGQKFDSSYDRGEPLTIGLQSVIPGWQQGLIGMKVGGKRRLIIPASLGYGSQATGNIPANSDLVFEIELLKVTHAK